MSARSALVLEKVGKRSASPRRTATTSSRPSSGALRRRRPGPAETGRWALRDVDLALAAWVVAILVFERYRDDLADLV